MISTIRRITIVFLLLSSLDLSSQSKARQEVLIFAGAALKDYAQALTLAYEKDQPRIKLLWNFGPSGTLAKQLEQAPVAALFLSAHPQWTNYLVSKGLSQASDVRPIFINRLVIAERVGASSAPMKTLSRSVANQLEGIFPGKIALGDPAFVPAGLYAYQVIENLGWKGKLEQRLILCADVRSAMQTLISGEADSAFVYQSDLLGRAGLYAAYDFEDGLHEPILFTALPIRASGKTEEAKALLEFAFGEKGRSIAKDYGLEMAPEPQTKKGL